jgi:hypothetical protein
MEEKEEGKGNLLDRIKGKRGEFEEEQIALLSTMVRLGVVVWAGFIITLNYVELPGNIIKKSGSSDITFVASIFTGALASFGLNTANSKSKATPVDCPMVKKKE